MEPEYIKNLLDEMQLDGETREKVIGHLHVSLTSIADLDLDSGNVI